MAIEAAISWRRDAPTAEARPGCIVPIRANQPSVHRDVTIVPYHPRWTGLQMGRWEYRRIEAKNRAALKEAEQAEIESDGYFTDPDLREVISPDEREMPGDEVPGRAEVTGADQSAVAGRP
jgi:hypothetical protein